MKEIMYKNKKIILIIAAGLVLLFSVMSFSVTTADASASKLDIYVGYYGGPYYLKKSYSVNDMYSLPTHRRVYSFIDAAPRPCLDCAIGVDMEDLISDAKIDMNSIETFYFYTSDSGDTYYTSFPKSELIDTVRYYYPELYRHFDKLQGGTEGAEEGAVAVPAMLAISDDFIKMEAGDIFVENYDDQSSENRFRLLFGQTDTVTRNATRSAKYVGRINVMLGGYPTITAPNSYLDMKVGSKKNISITIDAADILLGKKIKESITWTSSDESVATVDRNGMVTVTGEGEAVITAKYKDQSVEVTINGEK
ncbi:MAG TPA: Ig-like domain-containing protein, partial [Bacillota bacterium]|nr:Ig-like domain-containing protein [Bacillota bacterium]